MGTPPSSKAPPPPPPQPPRESFARRYKFVWPLLLTVNIAVGAYLFMRTKKKDTDTQEEVPNVPPRRGPTTVATVAVPVTEKTISPSPPIIEPEMLRDPIPENQQRELFKWLLEEKRKVKPKDSEEKKRIDEEKAILKQFIQAKSIPSLWYVNISSNPQH
ncbi:Beta-mannosyltransferase [Actinidia chinensis var. chinensis]|uniref:Beta-mannosyltransferase n=1 Tax=Actinidia chinensis var. chinensis TaxID=1590841 RepID=A0A2R6QFG1_ACTCC|nr:Beta-mannosyltransferase [Actinidia chinensis var. chinensis]